MGGHLFTLLRSTISALVSANKMTQSVLPDDILHLLCEELANQEQFDTLFNCACASRALAVPALTHLYKYVALASLLYRQLTDVVVRSHHLAPVRGGGEDLYGLPAATKLLTIQKWYVTFTVRTVWGKH